MIRCNVVWQGTAACWLDETLMPEPKETPRRTSCTAGALVSAGVCHMALQKGRKFSTASRIAMQ